MLKTRDLAVLAREHDAAKLTAHVVFSLDQPPAIHFTIAKLNCKNSLRKKSKVQETLTQQLHLAAQADKSIFQRRHQRQLTRDDVSLCFVQQLDWESNAAHRKQTSNRREI